MDFPEINCSDRDSAAMCRYFYCVRTFIVTIIVIIVRVNNKSMVEILIHTHIALIKIRNSFCVTDMTLS